MKTNLIFENGIKISAPMDEPAALELLSEFVKRLGTGYKTPQNEAASAEVKTPKEIKTLRPATYPSETKLVFFNCERCGDVGVIKVPKSTDIGDVVSCRCGHEMQIKSIKRAAGDCPNCETKFYGMYAINGATELQCRSCKGTVDLVEKADGTLTGGHNMKY